MDLLSDIRAVAGPLALAEGVELLDVVLVREGYHQVLRLTIERPAGPTTVSDCESVSRAVSVALDSRDLIPSRYFLEVSSAGADRPLRSLPDFRRSVGQLVRIEERGVRSGPWIGTLRVADDTGIVIESSDGSRKLVALSDIASARREVAFGPEHVTKP
jgi:ribosome maturation factor RimP